MTNLTIKNIPKHVHRRLKERAEDKRRSLNSEIIHILENTVTPQTVRTGDLLREIRRIREEDQKTNLTEEQIQSAIDEGRP